MLNKEYIKGYASALSSLATEEKKHDKYKMDAFILLEALESNETFLDIINSKKIDKKIRINIIEKSFKGIEKNLLNTLEILAMRSEAYKFIKILRDLIDFINENLGIHHGVVYSIQDLSPTDIKQIEKRVKKITGVIPELVNKIDTKLIAGVKVTIGDEVIDTSLKNQLHQLKMSLLKGGE